MTVVQQTLYKPGTAVPWANAKVVVALVGPGFVSGGQVLGDEFDLTDTAGFVSFDLAPTDTMTPSGCYYVWTGPDGAQWSFTVPSTGGPYTLQQSLISAPQNPNVITGVSSVDGHSGAVSLSGVYAPIEASPPDTSKFWRGDGAWAVPAGGSGMTATDNGDGTISLSGSSGYTDNGDGTISLS